LLKAAFSCRREPRREQTMPLSTISSRDYNSKCRCGCPKPDLFSSGFSFAGEYAFNNIVAHFSSRQLCSISWLSTTNANAWSMSKQTVWRLFPTIGSEQISIIFTVRKLAGTNICTILRLTLTTVYENKNKNETCCVIHEGLCSLHV
jgi:hypothetical protein